MNKEISAKQLKYSVGTFIIASSLLTSNLYYFVKNDSWVSVIIGFAASLLIVGIYVALSKRYPGFTLIEINDAVFGKFGGKAVSALYIFYFLSLACFNTRDLGDFVKGFILPGTPMLIIFIIFIFVCAVAVRKGPVNMTRYGFLMAVVAILSILLNSVLLLNMAEPKNLMPAFTLPLGNYLIGAHIVIMLPFCEIISFMMLIPDMSKSEAFGGAMRGGLIIGAATLLLIVVRDITVLGTFDTIFSMPTFSSVRLIDIGDLLTRLEIIYAVILMWMLFFKVSVVYYAAVSGISRMLGIDYSSIIYVIGALIIVYASGLFRSLSEHAKWNLTTAATYSSLFILILPVTTLVVALIRGHFNSRIIQPQA